MNSDRWFVKSLRRFSDWEIIINIYLLIGGVISFAYMGCAIWRTKLYAYVFSSSILSQGGAIAHVALQITVQAILRTALWLPQMMYAGLAQHVSPFDWITAINIMKDLT